MNVDFQQREKKFTINLDVGETHNDAEKAGCSGRGGEVTATTSWRNED